MYNSMNLVARRGRGCASSVGGARVGASAARVNHDDSMCGGAARVNNANRYDDTTFQGMDSVASAVSAVQDQVCSQK